VVLRLLSIPVFRGLILLDSRRDSRIEFNYCLSIPVFRGLILLVTLPAFEPAGVVWAFNPRFQGTYFVSV